MVTFSVVTAGGGGSDGGDAAVFARVWAYLPEVEAI
jgi:hypothetical protein